MTITPEGKLIPKGTFHPDTPEDLDRDAQITPAVIADIVEDIRARFKDLADALLKGTGNADAPR